MFRLNEVYENGAGGSVRIICVDSDYRYGSGAATAKHCPIIGLVTAKGMKYPSSVLPYDEKGYYCGVEPKGPHSSYKLHCLLSNEPTEEELKLIEDIRGIIANGADDDVAMVKVLRNLKK